MVVGYPELDPLWNTVSFISMSTYTRAPQRRPSHLHQHQTITTLSPNLFLMDI